MDKMKYCQVMSRYVSQKTHLNENQDYGQGLLGESGISGRKGRKMPAKEMVSK